MIENKNQTQREDHRKIYKAVLSTLFKEKNNCMEKSLLVEKINSKTRKLLQTGLFENQINEALKIFEQSHLIIYTEDGSKVMICLTSIGKDISSLIRDSRRKQKRDLTYQYQLILTKILIERKTIHENDIDRSIKSIGLDEKIKGLRNKFDNIQAINDLYSADLVSKKTERNENKNMVSLTSLGEEVGQLILNLIYYNDSYLKLSKLLEERVLCIPDDVIAFLEADPRLFKGNEFILKSIEEARHKLLDAGWRTRELQYYNKLRTILTDFKHLCDKNFPYIVLYLYSNILSKYNNIQNNEKSFKIIKDLVLNQLNKRSQILINNYQKESLGYYVLRFIHGEKNSISPERVSNIMIFFNDLEDAVSGLKLEEIPQKMKEDIITMRNSYLRLLKDKDEKLQII